MEHMVVYSKANLLAVREVAPDSKWRIGMRLQGIETPGYDTES